MPAVGSAAIQHGFGSSYAEAASVLLLVPGLAALVLEPVVYLLADRYPRRWFVCGGLAGMAVAALVAAAAPSPWVLAAALSLAVLASGTGVTLAQATLVDARPGDRERVLARWVLLGQVGDLLAPLALAGLSALAWGWRAGFVGAAAGSALLAVALWLRDFPSPAASHPSDPAGGGLAALRRALADRTLMAWAFATATCDLLDEILVVFASLHLRDQLGAGPVTRSLMLAGFVVGGIAGLTVVDRMVARAGAHRLLIASGVTCTVAYLAWLATPSLPLSAALLVVVGASAAPLYPLAMAQTYAAWPGHSGTVLAARHVYAPITMMLPWLLGVLADRAGSGAALAVLVVEPVAVTAVALATRPRRAAPPAG